MKKEPNPPPMPPKRRWWCETCGWLEAPEYKHGWFCRKLRRLFRVDK